MYNSLDSHKLSLPHSQNHSALMTNGVPKKTWAIFLEAAPDLDLRFLHANLGLEIILLRKGKWSPFSFNLLAGTAEQDQSFPSSKRLKNPELDTKPHLLLQVVSGMELYDFLSLPTQIFSFPHPHCTRVFILFHSKPSEVYIGKRHHY